MTQTMEELLRSADVGSDPAWKSLLSRANQFDGFPAPADLRDLAASIFPTSLDLAIRYGGGMLTWLSECVYVSGEPAALRAALLASLRRMRYIVRAETEILGERGSQRLRIVERGAAVGPERPWCGAALEWSVTGAPRATTLRSLLAALPLRDERIEASIYDALEPMTIHGLRYGGNWTKRYMWEISLDGGAESVVEPVLARLGYVRNATEYRRASTRSVVWVDRRAGLVELRFQPQA